ncbi:MAG: site-specific DNA-methyltransferase [Sedimenticola sp.]
MSKRKQKLELTWIGKENRPKLEPRILLEDPALSHHADQRVTEHDQFDNKLIFGDNLLALKALEQEYAGKVKCVFIDPPFNTGGAFEYYDDGVEHSLWLDLMRKRFDILFNLLSKDGAIVVNLDDSEMAYCKVIMDEVFERQNYVTTIVVEAATGSSFKTVNIGPIDTAQYLLFYARDKKTFQYHQQYLVKSKIDLQHFSRFIVNHEDPCEKWKFVSINDHILSELGYIDGSIQRRWNEIKRKLGDTAKILVKSALRYFKWVSQSLI